MDWSTKQLLKEKETMVKDGDIRLSDCLGDEHFQEHYKRETMQFLDSAPGVPKLVLADSKQVGSASISRTGFPLHAAIALVSQNLCAGVYARLRLCVRRTISGRTPVNTMNNSSPC